MAEAFAAWRRSRAGRGCASSWRSCFVEGALLYGATAFVALDLHLRFGLSLGASGSMVAAFALGGLLYAAFAGRLVPRLGERGLVLGGGV